MKKLIRDTSSQKNREFWEAVRASAAGLQGAPDWMKAGIDLNERNYTTFEPRVRDRQNAEGGAPDAE